MEALIGQKLPAYPCDEETVLVLQERVNEAQRLAVREMRETQVNKCVVIAHSSEGTYPQAPPEARSLPRLVAHLSLPPGSDASNGFPNAAGSRIQSSPPTWLIISCSFSPECVPPCRISHHSFAHNDSPPRRTPPSLGAAESRKGKRKGASEDGAEDAETVVRSFKRKRMGGGGGGHGKRGGKRSSGGRR